MSKARLVITAVVVEGRSQAEVARSYGVSKGWVSKLLARYRAEGETAFEPRSRRPKTSPTSIDAATVELITRTRKELSDQGLDAGPETIAWHLEHHHQVQVSRTTISRYLTASGLVVPTPKKRPRSSYIRFQAELPNETWQADFTHYRLVDSTDTEILTWLDDHSRYALHVTAWPRVTGPIVHDTFRAAVAAHGIPASTLTDNGMVFTTRLSGGRGGRNALEHELRRLHITQKNSTPNHPTTCGKVERFQCATRRMVVSPVQPGGTRREVPGSDGLPDAERLMGQEHARKPEAVPNVRGGALGDPRDMAKAGLPESQSPEDGSSHPPERRLKPVPALPDGVETVGQPPGCWSDAQ